MFDVAKRKPRVVLRVDVDDEGPRVVCRRPTSKERVAYNREIVLFKGRKTTSDTVKAQIKYGSRLIIGLVDGDWGYDGKPVSSNKDSDNYREDWRAVTVDLLDEAPIGVALHFFVPADAEEVDDDEQGDGDQGQD